MQLILQIEQVEHIDFTPSAMALLKAHPWPGNVRQLHNVLRTAIALADGGAIDVTHFTQDFLAEMVADEPVAIASLPSGAIEHNRVLQAVTDDYVRTTMQAHQGNISAVARQLGISRNTLYRKLKNLDLA